LLAGALSALGRVEEIEGEQRAKGTFRRFFMMSGTIITISIRLPARSGDNILAEDPILKYPCDILDNKVSLIVSIFIINTFEMIYIA
jgi:hypothetical protein